MNEHSLHLTHIHNYYGMGNKGNENNVFDLISIILNVKYQEDLSQYGKYQAMLVQHS
jgi:hypothetical protein